MIRHLRADVTRYTIWHRSLTAPAVANSPELRHAYLMSLDIEALSHSIENLMWGYARNGWLGRLPATLDRLKTNIDDPRWIAKIAYDRGICALWREDRAQAAREIALLQPITLATTDVDLLRIHVAVHGSKISMTERIAFFERIEALSDSRSDKLQYGGARAFELLSAQDGKGARAAFDAIIARGREMEEEKALSDAAGIWFCRVLECRAVLDHDTTLFKEIDARLGRMLAQPGKLSRFHKAVLWRARGNARRFAGNYASAIKAYRASGKLVAAPELRTFEAECELDRGNPDEAYRLVRAVLADGLGEPERADHAFTYCRIALVLGDRQSLMEARDLLTATMMSRPYLEKLRWRHIATIKNALEALDNQEELPGLGPVLFGLKKATRYLQLRPTWNSIGINANAVFDDLRAALGDKLKRDAA